MNTKLLVKFETETGCKFFSPVTHDPISFKSSQYIYNDSIPKYIAWLENKILTLK
jgi:hypothetical protein